MVYLYCLLIFVICVSIINIYVSVDNEPDVIAAVGDGRGDKINVVFGIKYLVMTIPASGYTFKLGLDYLYGATVPDESKYKVTPGKKICLTLKKHEVRSWPKLLTPYTPGELQRLRTEFAAGYDRAPD